MKFRIALCSIVFLFCAVSCTIAQKGKTEPIATNPWMNTTWKVNGVPFESKETKQYFFSTYDASNFGDHWGHFITFDRETFSSSYSAMCGNDCFTSVNGTFYFTADNKVRIKVLNIDRHGFCSAKSETLNQDFGYYDVVQTENGWQVTKSE